MISVTNYCANNNIDLTSMVGLLKKYQIDYSKIGRDYFVKDTSILDSLFNKHLVNSISERKRKRESAINRAKLTKEASLLRQRLLEEGLTPDEISTLINSNTSDDIPLSERVKNKIRSKQVVRQMSDSTDQSDEQEGAENE